MSATFRGNVARILNRQTGAVAFASLIALLVVACRNIGSDGAGFLGVETTYQRFLLRAEDGDAESQNIVGFMLYYGEGVPADRARAEQWFRRSAEQGNERGRRNLALMSSAATQDSGAIPARRHVDDPGDSRVPGERTYMRFCAGCHGFNGFSAYVHSPSFALGQSLDKSNEELLRSILRGKGEMPNWDDKLPLAELQAVLRFIRTLRSSYESGVGQPLRAEPSYYYLFGPMESKPPDQRGISR